MGGDDRGGHRDRELGGVGEDRTGGVGDLAAVEVAVHAQGHVRGKGGLVVVHAVGVDPGRGAGLLVLPLVAEAGTRRRDLKGGLGAGGGAGGGRVGGDDREGARHPGEGPAVAQLHAVRPARVIAGIVGRGGN